MAGIEIDVASISHRYSIVQYAVCYSSSQYRVSTSPRCACYSQLLTPTYPYCELHYTDVTQHTCGISNPELSLSAGPLIILWCYKLACKFDSQFECISSFLVTEAAGAVGLFVHMPVNFLLLTVWSSTTQKTTSVVLFASCHRCKSKVFWFFILSGECDVSLTTWKWHSHNLATLK